MLEVNTEAVPVSVLQDINPGFSAEELELLSRPCACKVSTGIHGGLTRGTGRLDDNGFWQHECNHRSHA